MAPNEGDYGAINHSVQYTMQQQKITHLPSLFDMTNNTT